MFLSLHPLTVSLSLSRRVHSPACGTSQRRVAHQQSRTQSRTDATQILFRAIHNLYLYDLITCTVSQNPEPWTLDPGPEIRNAERGCGIAAAAGSAGHRSHHSRTFEVHPRVDWFVLGAGFQSLCPKLVRPPNQWNAPRRALPEAHSRVCGTPYRCCTPALSSERTRHGDKNTHFESSPAMQAALIHHESCTALEATEGQIDRFI